MEKKTPHCKLATVRSLIQNGRYRVTRAALLGAAALEVDEPEILRIVMSLTPGDFHKSMTTYTDHRVWQDVYRPWTAVGSIYLKLTVVDDLAVVSFKEL